MPKKVINDYTFYKIVCLDNSVELCYVGSTADFNKRRNTHKNACINENNKNYNYKIYKTIRENGGWDNFKLIQIGTREQLNKREAEQIEEEYRQELKANMNGKKCFRTKEQKQEYCKEYNQKYRDENRDKIKERNQKWYEENKDKLSIQHKEYYETNVDKIKEQKQNYNQENRVKNNQRSQKYREQNRDIINDKASKYYKENKDKINEKVKCECGCVVIKRTLLRHQKSPKHIKIMEIKTENKNWK